MRKLTKEERDKQAIFKYSRCNGCIHANCTYGVTDTLIESVGVKSQEIWFTCNLGLTENNKPLHFVNKCSHRYDT